MGRDLFEEVERTLSNDRHMKMPLFFKLWFAFVGTLAFVIFAGVIYSFFNPEPLAKLSGRALGTVMREADRAYNEQ